MNAIDLVRLAEEYARHCGLTLSTVSTYAQRDGKFFDRLRGGGCCTLRVAERNVRWFDSNWPRDLEWPRDIPRPSKSKKEAA